LQSVAIANDEPFQYKLVFSAASPSVLLQPDCDLSHWLVEAVGKHFQKVPLRLLCAAIAAILCQVNRQSLPLAQTNSIHS